MGKSQKSLDPVTQVTALPRFEAGKCMYSPLSPLPWSLGPPLTSKRRPKGTGKGSPFSERDNFSTFAFSLFWKTLRPHPATRSPMGIPH